MKEKINTIVYGASDDLIEVENGPCSGEVGCYGTDEKEKGVLLVFDDGTILEVKYGKNDSGIWGVTAHHKGSEFDRIETCEDEDADPYSDVAYFKCPMKKCYAATEWEVVR